MTPEHSPKLKTQIRWAVLAVLALLLEAGVNLAVWQSYSDATQWSVHTHQVLEALQKLESAVANADSSQRLYLFTGNKGEYLSPYRTSLAESDFAAAEIVRLTADNPSQGNRIREARSLMAEKFAMMNRSVQLQEENESARALEPMSRGTEPRVARQLRRIVADMKKEELRLLAQREQRYRSDARKGALVIAAGSVILLSLIVAGDITIRRRTASLNREVADNARGREEFRRLAGRLQTIREEDRTRLARELHDEMGQALTVVKIGLSTAAGTLRKGEAEPALSQVDALAPSIDGLIRTTRRIASDLRPPLLDHLGLSAALEAHAAELRSRAGIEIRVSSDHQPLPLNAEQTVALFRIAQESLTNVLRHAQACLVAIDLRCEKRLLTMTIHDNGTGFQRGATSSLGLLGMEERARMSGATLEIDSQPGSGTTVRVHLPLES